MSLPCRVTEWGSCAKTLLSLRAGPARAGPAPLAGAAPRSRRGGTGEPRSSLSPPPRSWLREAPVATEEGTAPLSRSRWRRLPSGQLPRAGSHSCHDTRRAEAPIATGPLSPSPGRWVEAGTGGGGGGWRQGREAGGRESGRPTCRPLPLRSGSAPAAA